jgi:hypothetical protein
MKVWQWAAVAAIGLVTAGCGGLFSANSTILIHLKQNPNITQPTAQVMNVGYEIYVVPNGGTLNLANTSTYATTQNNPNLLDNYIATRSSTTEIDLQFTTRGAQAPYYIYVGVPTESGSTDTVGVSVDVDASTGAVKAFTFPTGTQTQVTSGSYPTPVTPVTPAQINRNSASY